MKLDVDFQISHKDYGFKTKDDLASIKILTGPFIDTEFTFNVITLAEEENPDGTMSISFDYTIHESKEPIVEDILSKFEIVLGDVLNSILTNALHEAEKRYKNESREENPKAPTE